MRIQTGTLTVTLLLGIAIVLGGFSILYHHQSGNQALAYWGSDQAELIGHAPRVDWLRLSPVEDPDATPTESMLTVDGRMYRVVETRDVTGAPGFTYVRRALLQDDSFEFGVAEPKHSETMETWYSALCFISEDDNHVYVYFDQSFQHVFGNHGSRAVGVGPISKGLRAVLGKMDTSNTDEPVREDAP